jgi:protein-L-isoaspartate(D-aspartate) O-methyltransferase
MAQTPPTKPPSPPPRPPHRPDRDHDDPYLPLRQVMVEIIAAHTQATFDQTGIAHIRTGVLEAMLAVARHEFVPTEIRAYAHSDGPLPIGWDKTISQPFICALMTELLDVQPDHRVLEIGTGLGYHTALLAHLAKHVYTIEIVEELAGDAEARLERAGIKNVSLRIGNGAHGWPEHAPFDRIILAAAPELIPPMLIGQLKAGGRMVLPCGLNEAQQLCVVEKNEDHRIKVRDVLPVRFAPMEGVGF